LIRYRRIFGDVVDAAVTSEAMSRPRIVLYDDARARAFEPFATSRPLSEMRAGATLIRDRWSEVCDAPVTAFASVRLHDAFREFDAPPSVVSLGLLSIPAGTILVNARALPLLTMRIDGDASSWAIESRVAAVRLAAPLDAQALRDGSLDLESLAPSRTHVAIEGVWLDDVWDIIRHLQLLLVSDIPALAARLDCRALDDDGHSARGPVLHGGHPVWLEDGAAIEPFAFVDTTLGPVLLRRGAVVQAFTRVVGPCYIGRDSTVMADRIAGSAIGDACRVHGELSTSVFLGHANKGHDGFVGHSILGRWVNLGANTVTSNLKNTYGPVALWTPDGVRDTGLQFLGTLFGDHAKTGIGLRLTTGCVIGAGANVMEAMPPKVVPPFSWGSRTPYALFAADKFLETAARMMSRRQVTLDAGQQAHLAAVYAAAIADARWPSR